MDGFRNNITAVIITYNEEERIQSCIKSVQKVTDEIIIVDHFSTDDTVFIAEKAGAKVIQRKWLGYGNAKNYGASAASRDWILSIDADEQLSEALIQEIKTIQLTKNKLYGFRRSNFIGDQKIRFGEWNPDIKYRLYHRKECTWDNSKVHEKLKYSAEVKKVILRNLLFHYSYKDVTDLQKRLEQYALLSAQEMEESNNSPGYLYFLLKAVFRFIKGYIFKLGLLDGKMGFKIAYLNALSVFKRWKYSKSR
jgi:(heptosyl)LPS beta-1,4-glucosyltransferase